MKKLVGATITLLCLLFCLPASAIAASRHKVTHHRAAANRKAKVTRAHTARWAKSNIQHANTAERSAERSHAGLRAASYHPLAEPQSSGSSAASSSSAAARASSKKKAAAKKKRRQPSQMAPTSDRISEIQSALARGGYYKADPNGKWDGVTVDALQRFQSANGLDSSGKLDALTLQKLGLGSDVAGYSAPKGIVEHSCCSMTPSPSHAPPLAQTAAASSHSSAASTSASPAGAAAPAAQDPAAAAGTGPESTTQQQNASH